MKKNILMFTLAGFAVATPLLSLAESSTTNGVTQSLPSQPEAQDSIPRTLKDIMNPNPQTHGFWAGQWEKAKLSFGQNLIRKNTTIMGSVGAGLSVDYDYLIQPAFVQNKQQRIDTYSAAASLSKALPVKGVSVGGALNARASFSRILDEKTDAATQTPYFLNKIPWDTTTAQNELNPGDVVRVEFSTSLSFSDGLYKDISGYGGNVYASISRGAHLLLDIYKIKTDQVRVRLIAIRRTGDVSGGFILEPIHPLTIASNIIEKTVSHSLALHPLSFGMSGNSRAQLPVQTYMLDYVFDLSNEEVASAYNTLMNNIGTINITEYLNFQLSESTVGARMLFLAQDVEKLVQKYSHLPIPQRPLDRVFKGETATTYATGHFGSQLRLGLNLWNKQVDNSNSRTNIQHFNDKEEQNNMLYLSNYIIDNFEFGWNFWQTLKLNQAEMLAGQATGENTLSVSDLVFTRNLSDKSMKDKDFMAAKSFISMTIPALAQKIDWTPYLNGKSKHNGYIQIKTVFHKSTLDRIEATEREIYDRLHAMVDAYPGYIESSYYADPEDETLNTNGPLEYDIRKIASSLSTILSKTQDIQLKLEAFSIIRQLKLYQELGAALIASFLPAEELNNLIYMNVEIGASELPYISEKVGRNSLTKSYSSLQFMLGLINNRSFDLRLQLEATEIPSSSALVSQ